MKAICVHNYGSPEVLQYEEIQTPSPQSDEILVRMKAAGVNPVDWKAREGYLKEVLPRNFPFIPGWDMAGDIVMLGNSVKEFKLDDPVFGFIDLARQGTYAEYVIVKTNEIALKPKALNYTQAAAVPLAALTAWQVLFDVANLNARQVVLVHGAAGGVGHFAAQLAKWKGAYVIGTASEKNKSFLLSELHADEFVDYKAVNWDSYQGKIDVIVDVIGGETQKHSWPLLKKGGMLVSIADPTSLEKNAEKYGVRARFYIVKPNTKQLAQISELIDQSKLHPHVSLTFPLAEARQAQVLSQTGHVRGKIVLSVGGS